LILILYFIVFGSTLRFLVNGKTGTELVWGWLKKHDLEDYIFNVTAMKPVAAAYIDDKCIRFNNWKEALKIIENGDF